MSEVSQTHHDFSSRRTGMTVEIGKERERERDCGLRLTEPGSQPHGLVEEYTPLSSSSILKMVNVQSSGSKSAKPTISWH